MSRGRKHLTIEPPKLLIDDVKSASVISYFDTYIIYVVSCAFTVTGVIFEIIDFMLLRSEIFVPGFHFISICLLLANVALSFNEKK